MKGPWLYEGVIMDIFIIDVLLSGLKKKRMEFRYAKTIHISGMCERFNYFLRIEKRPKGCRKHFSCNNLKSTPRQCFLSIDFAGKSNFPQRRQNVSDLPGVAAKYFESVMADVQGYIALISTYRHFSPSGAQKYLRHCGGTAICEGIVDGKQKVRVVRLLTHFKNVRHYKAGPQNGFRCALQRIPLLI
jgi:hypothetical protein